MKYTMQSYTSCLWEVLHYTGGGAYVYQSFIYKEVLVKMPDIFPSKCVRGLKFHSQKRNEQHYGIIADICEKLIVLETLSLYNVCERMNDYETLLHNAFFN